MGTVRGILEIFVWASHKMIPVIRPRQPREEKMKCGSQSADIRMIHRRKHHPCAALLIPCCVYNLTHRIHPFVSQRETASCLLTEKAILEIVVELNSIGGWT